MTQSLQIEPPKWTFIFIALSVAGFLFQMVTNFWGYFAFFPAFAFESPWMFVTSIFLHADIEHLFFNMLILFFLGINLERSIGKKAFMTLFFVSGIVGNLGYLITASNPFTPAIGASGAIYGIIGALATLAPMMMVFIGMIPMPMILVAVFWGFMDFAGLFAPSGIAHGAHLGGMFVGITFGLYIRWKIHLRVNRY